MCVCVCVVCTTANVATLAAFAIRATYIPAVLMLAVDAVDKLQNVCFV